MYEFQYILYIYVFIIFHLHMLIPHQDTYDT